MLASSSLVGSVAVVVLVTVFSVCAVPISAGGNAEWGIRSPGSRLALSTRKARKAQELHGIAGMCLTHPYSYQLEPSTLVPGPPPT